LVEHADFSESFVKRQLVLLINLICVFLFLSQGRADEISNNFSAQISQPALDALAQDVGSVMGGGSFHQGKVLGFPLGFDVGIHVPVVKLDNNNTILKDDSSSVQALWSQLEIGLPAKINFIGRYGKFYDGNTMGGGLKYGIIKSMVPAVPSISVSVLYNKLEHDYFDMDTYSANAALSFDLPFIHPYIGLGYDHSLLKPTALAFVGVPGNISRSLEGEANGYRAEAGINVSIIPFTYLTVGAGLANGNSMYHAGVGAKF
jgi:hypothetical protein